MKYRIEKIENKFHIKMKFLCWWIVPPTLDENHRFASIYDTLEEAEEAILYEPSKGEIVKEINK